MTDKSKATNAARKVAQKTAKGGRKGKYPDEATIHFTDKVKRENGKPVFHGESHAKARAQSKALTKSGMTVGQYKENYAKLDKQGEIPEYGSATSHLTYMVKRGLIKVSKPGQANKDAKASASKETKTASNGQDAGTQAEAKSEDTPQGTGSSTPATQTATAS